MATPSPSSDIVHAESNHQASTIFQEYVRAHPARGADGYGNPQDYITFDDLEQYWTTQAITQLFVSFTPPFVLPIDKVTKHFLRTLSILAFIGQVGYFDWFIRHDQDDSRLPHNSKPHQFPGGDDLWEVFSKNQWKFCPFYFNRAPLMKPLDANCILPITILENLSPITADTSIPIIQKVSLKYGNEDQVVVFKTYTGVQSRHLWVTEANTFQKIFQSGDCKHVVHCLGSFEQTQSNKYTIVLEYSDGGTLLDLFKEDVQPLKHADRVRFWERLFELLIGLQRIHGLYAGMGPGDQMLLKSIHLDIKPANILVFKGDSSKPQDCLFKLADFGSSPTVVERQGQITRAKDTGGTPMYSPPECCRDFRHLGGENLSVTSDADIWSLGCVFSEVLVWTTMREEGRKVYQRRRIKATMPRMADAGYGGCFHNAMSRLDVVDEMHNEAQQYTVRDDKITSIVSSIILTHMLRSKENGGRLPATNLHRVFLDKVEDMAKSSEPPDIKQAGEMVKSYGVPGKTQVDRVALKEQKPSDVSRRKSKTWASTTSTTSSNEDRPSAIPLRPLVPNTRQRTPPPSPLQPRTSAAGSTILLPMVTVADVNEWRQREGGRKISKLVPGRRAGEELEGMNNLQRLKGRDQYFIIDDSLSMKKDQKKVVDTFQALAYLVKRIDEDGIDMYFMSDPKTPHHNKHTSQLVRLIQQRKFGGDAMPNLSLDAMANVIITRNLPYRRPASLYVLTNGDWGIRGRSLGGVDKVVERLVRELGKRNEAASFIALQFIRFGDVPDGIRRLKKLDNLGKPRLKTSKNPKKKVLEKDIVDHSSYDGSVWKMLIGSLVEGVDNDSDDDEDDWDEDTGDLKS